MPPPPDPSARDRQEIDDLHRRLPTSTHYEVLGVERSVDAGAVQRAHKARTQRFSPESLHAPLTNAYMQRLEAVQEALDTALAVLGDPVRRYLYDQDLDQRARSVTPPPSPAAGVNPLKRTPPPGTLQSPPLGARPLSGTSTPAMPRTPTPPGGYRPPNPPAPITPRAPTPPPTEPLGVLQPEARPTPTSLAAPGASQAPPPPRFKQTGPQPIGARRDDGAASGSQPPQEAAAGDRVAALEAHVQTLQGEVGTLLAEVERLAVSIQLTIARQLEPDGIKHDQLVSAGQALVSSRVAIASLLARREEAAGRWEAASALWQRASRARPGEVLLLVNAANALRKAGTDMAGAEALARQAIALDPDNADAHAALAVIEARRRPSA
jgi:tetratricopeptide (TPR) repeat protein